MMMHRKSPSRRKTWILLLSAVILMAAAASSFFWQTNTPASASGTQPVYQTAAVRTGNIALSVFGSGSLAAGSTLDLGFATQGTIAQLNVEVGDKVKAGDVLAVLGEIDGLKVDVTTKQLALEAAQKELNKWTSEKSERLAQALVDRAAAYQAYEDAKDHLLKQGQGRCSSSVIDTYYFEYLYAKMNVDQWQGYLDDGNTGYGTNFILSKLRPMKNDMNLAEMNYLYCLSYTSQEVLHSEANLMTAEANFKWSEAVYQELVANSGVDPLVLAIAEAKVANAAHEYAQAQEALAGAAIIAPIDGTVTKVNGTVGAKTESAALLTLADLDHPSLTITLDESDFNAVGVGCPVDVSFEAVSSTVYHGKVTQIEPSLVSVRNVETIRGQASLDSSELAGRTLPLGLNASIEVTCKEANDVLMIPSEAVKGLSGSTAHVYVLNESGQPEKRAVEVGLKTTAFAEIRSGLSLGERVITNGKALK